MLTIDDLRRFGADVEDGLGRCMNDEAFYLELVNMTLEDGCFEKLSGAVEAGDKKAAFDAAHALKGIVANVSLTPLYREVAEMTELLRAGQDADYPDYLKRIVSLRNALLSLKNNRTARTEPNADTKG